MEKWTREIDALTVIFTNEFGGLSPAELNWKMHPNSWSIAQNIEHLIIINESYNPVIESAHNGTQKLPFIARIGFIVNFLGRAIFKSSGPDRRKKIKTFAIWSPSESILPPDMLQKFRNHHEKLKTLIQNSAPLIKKGTVISSPANRLIVYKLEAAFNIIVAHEKRHLEQCREVLKHMKSS
jgi:hypothetical protein